MTQKIRLAKYLENHKKINPLEAWQLLGIYRLSDVVFKLRKEGWNIKTNDTVVQNQFGENCVVAEYLLDHDALQQ